MKKTVAYYLLILPLFSLSCGEKDVPVLKGDIQGAISLVDAYGYSLLDRSGVQVQLTGEDAELETFTDSYGRYNFHEIPAGNYLLKLTKEEYVEKTTNYIINHVGGEAATVINLFMVEVPKFHYGIDSMKYHGSFLDIYYHIIGATKTFVNFNYLHFFFSHSPDVSCFNHEHSFMFWNNEHVINWVFYDSWYNFLPEYTGIVYCRVYPQADCDVKFYANINEPHPIYPETLGPPSEVFSFTVEGISVSP